MAVMEHVCWPLWGCAEEWVKMVLKCIVGLFWGTNFQHGGKFVPQNSPTMHFDNHLDPCNLKVANMKLSFAVICLLSVSRDWFEFLLPGFSEAKINLPQPSPCGSEFGRFSAWWWWSGSSWRPSNGRTWGWYPWGGIAKFLQWRLYPSNNNQLDFQKSPSSARDDFVAPGRPLRGQTRLVPLAKRATCSKSNNQPADDQRAEVAEYHENIKIFILKRDNTKVLKKVLPNSHQLNMFN